MTEDQSSPEKAKYIEDKYSTIRGAKNAPKKPRKISVSIGGIKTDRTETCFINSEFFPAKAEENYCPDRIDSSVSLETALDLREAQTANKHAENALIESKNANDIARSARAWAIIATIIATIAIVAPYVMSKLSS